MNYPSLSLNAELIGRVFSQRNTAPEDRSLSKIITKSGKQNNMSEPQGQSNVNGEVKVCDHCDYKTSMYEDMFNHIRQSHSGQGIKHKCPECNLTNTTLFRIKRHLYEVHLKIGQMKKCDHCDYTNLKYDNLYIHKRQHHMSHLKQKCTECENTYSYHSKLKKHFNEVHLKIQRNQQGQKMYPTICRKNICPEFHTKRCKELEKHSLFYCDQCSFSSPRNDKIKFHVQNVHEGVIFKCEKCTACTVKERRLV